MKHAARLIVIVAAWMFIFSCTCGYGCGGLSARGASPVLAAATQTECDSIERSYELWGAVAVAASSAAGASSLAEIFPDDKGVRVGLAVFALADAALGAMSVFLRDSYTGDYTRTCVQASVAPK